MAKNSRSNGSSEDEDGGDDEEHERGLPKERILDSKHGSYHLV